jgi:hypothetical protein
VQAPFHPWNKKRSGNLLPARQELDCPQCQHRMARARKGNTYVDQIDSRTFAECEKKIQFWDRKRR